MCFDLIRDLFYQQKKLTWKNLKACHEMKPYLKPCTPNIFFSRRDFAAPVKLATGKEILALGRRGS